MVRPQSLVRHLSTAILALATLAGTVAPGFAHPAQIASAVPNGRGNYVPGELLIQFEPGLDDAEKDAIRGHVRGALKRELRRPRHGRGAQRAEGVLELVALPPDVSVEDAASALQGEPGIEFAEPNLLRTADEVSNDPYLLNGSLWGLASGASSEFGTHAEDAWAAGLVGSNDVYVGIVDTGVQITHTDLSGQIWTNPFETPGNGVDDDGNGYVDDVRGWDFRNNDNSVFDNALDDDHGTHVSGTIGAHGGNGIGVIGVNWQVKLIPAKFIGSVSGSVADEIEAMDYLVDLKQRHGINIVATNNSYGGSAQSVAEYQAILRAAQAGILFVASAGNNSRDTDALPSFPAAYDTSPDAGYDSVISVAAIASDGTLATFSNYGASRVDLGAPGVGIWSTVPTNSYASFNGTSMAAPHVTGAVALYASQNPGASAAQIKQALLDSTVPTPSLAGKSVSGGRLNVFAALGGTPVNNDEFATPTSVNGLPAQFLRDTDDATEQSGEPTATDCGTIGKTVWYRHLANANGSLTVLSAGSDFDTLIAVYTGNAVDGLTPVAGGCNDNASGTSQSQVALQTVAGTTYYIQVGGNDGDSGSLAIAFTDDPPPPGGLQITGVNYTSLTLSWTDLTGESAYRIERKPAVGGSWKEIKKLNANVTSYTNTGLSPNTAYLFRLRADIPGQSPTDYSEEVSGSTLGPPPAPDGLNVGSPQVDRLLITWNDLAAEKDYRLERSPNGVNSWKEIKKLSTNVTSFTNTGLAAGTTYHYRLRAGSQAGFSAYSTVVSGTTLPLLPIEAPTDLQVGSPTIKSLTLTWIDASNNEKGFKIERQNPDGTWKQIKTVSAGVTTYIDGGRSRNTTHNYRVRAYNSAGNSNYSAEANGTTSP